MTGRGGEEEEEGSHTSLSHCVPYIQLQLASCKSEFSASTRARKLRASIRTAVRTSLLGKGGEEGGGVREEGEKERDQEKACLQVMSSSNPYL